MQLAVISLFIAVSSAVVAVAQDMSDPKELLLWYKDRLDVMIPDHREDLVAHLSEVQARVERGVKYETFAVGDVNAYALRTRDGRAVIHMSAGLMEMIDFLATMFAYAEEYKEADCLEAYLEYMTDRIRTNSEAVRRRGPLRPVVSAGAFIGKHPKLCRQVSEAQAGEDSRMNQIREALIGASLDFLLGHEMAHHVLLHVSRPSSSKAESRQQEQDADAFAFRLMAQMHTVPAAAMPVLYLFAGVEGFSPEGAGEDTHPTGISRVKEMFKAADRVVHSDPLYRREIEKSGRLAEWERLMAQLQKMGEE